jgi:hypothetical protein
VAVKELHVSTSPSYESRSSKEKIGAGAIGGVSTREGNNFEGEMFDATGEILTSIFDSLASFFQVNNRP